MVKAPSVHSMPAYSGLWLEQASEAEQASPVSLAGGLD